METETEFQLLKVLWELGQASVAQVRARYNEVHGTALAYTTVMTLLGRLAAKGAVKVDREREPFFYTAASRKQTVLRQRVSAFLASVFDGQADALVLHLVESEALSPKDLARIKEKVGRARKKRGSA